MKAELKQLALCLWAMLKEFVTSKKVLTAALTAVLGVVVKDTQTRNHLLEVGLVLLGAQGLTDVGKEAVIAKKADAPKEPTLFPPPGAP